MTQEERLQGLAIAKSLFSYMGKTDEVKKIDESISESDKESFNEKYHNMQIQDAIKYSGVPKANADIVNKAFKH